MERTYNEPVKMLEKKLRGWKEGRNGERKEGRNQGKKGGREGDVKAKIMGHAGEEQNPE